MRWSLGSCAPLPRTQRTNYDTHAHAGIGKFPAKPSLLSARDTSYIEPCRSMEEETKLDGSVDGDFSMYRSYNPPPSSSALSYTIVIAIDRWIRCRAMYQATLKVKSTIRKLPPSCGSNCHGRTLPLEEFAGIPRLHPRFIARFAQKLQSQR